MSTKPRIADVRAEMCARVGKCTMLDLDKLAMLMTVLEANRRMHRLNELTAYDHLMCDRFVLLSIALRSHDEDVARMLSWCRAVMNNGIKRRNVEKSSQNVHIS